MQLGKLSLFVCLFIGFTLCDTTCGGKCVWSYADGVLTVVGSGNMRDFKRMGAGYSAPWSDFAWNTTSVIIKGLSTVGTGAFYKFQSVTTVTLPAQLRSVGDNAFWLCSDLQSISIPATTTSIGLNAFYGCSRLVSGNIGEVFWRLDEARAAMAVRGSGTMLDFAFSGSRPWDVHSKRITSVRVGFGVRSVGAYWFYGFENLAVLVLPQGVTAIEEYALAYAGKLRVLRVPGSVTAIRKGACVGCKALEVLALGHGILSVGERAFAECAALSELVLPDTLVAIGAEAFSGCAALHTVTITADVSTVGERAFAGCAALTALNVAAENPSYASADGVLFTKDGKTLLAYPAGKPGTSYAIPDGVRLLGADAFNGSPHLVSVELPASLAKVGERAFAHCTALTGVRIPGGVAEIGASAFAYCDRLESAAIGGGVSCVSAKAFAYCYRLARVEYCGSTVQAGGKTDVFSKCDMLTSVRVPATYDGDDFYGVPVVKATDPIDAECRAIVPTSGWYAAAPLLVTFVSVVAFVLL